MSNNGAELHDVEEHGYPHDDLADLMTVSYGRFLEKVEEHGTGKNWLEDEARWHIWKACDELFQARNHVHYLRPEEARKHMADALNHMLFALEICRTNCEFHSDNDRGEESE